MILNLPASCSLQAAAVEPHRVANQQSPRSEAMRWPSFGLVQAVGAALSWSRLTLGFWGCHD